EHPRRHARLRSDRVALGLESIDEVGHAVVTEARVVRTGGGEANRAARSRFDVERELACDQADQRGLPARGLDFVGDRESHAGRQTDQQADRKKPAVLPPEKYQENGVRDGRRKPTSGDATYSTYREATPRVVGHSAERRVRAGRRMERKLTAHSDAHT